MRSIIQYTAVEPNITATDTARNHTGSADAAVMEILIVVNIRQMISLIVSAMVLRKRAEDILNMVDKTAAEFREMNIIRGGDIRIGCAESYLIKHLAHAISDFRRDYPLLRFHITSGGTEQVLERLDHGILDLAVIVEPPHLERYNYLEIPGEDTCVINTAMHLSSLLYACRRLRESSAC